MGQSCIRHPMIENNLMMMLSDSSCLNCVDNLRLHERQLRTIFMRKEKRVLPPLPASFPTRSCEGCPRINGLLIGKRICKSTPDRREGARKCTKTSAHVREGICDAPRPATASPEGFPWSTRGAIWIPKPEGRTRGRCTAKREVKLRECPTNESAYKRTPPLNIAVHQR
jgi:hypothetical protein